MEIRTGSFKIQDRPLNIFELIEDVSSSSSMAATERAVEIHSLKQSTHNLNKHPQFVTTDAERVSMVLENCVDKVISIAQPHTSIQFDYWLAPTNGLK